MMDPFEETRAKFVYEAVRQSSIAAYADIVPEKWESRDDDFREQFVAAVNKRCNTTAPIAPRTAHTEWLFAHLKMGWTYGAERNPFAKTHPNMVPYEKLPLTEKNKSKIFLAVCAIARDFLPDPDTLEADPNATVQDMADTGVDSCSMES